MGEVVVRSLEVEFGRCEVGCGRWGVRGMRREVWLEVGLREVKKINDKQREYNKSMPFVENRCKSIDLFKFMETYK